MSNSNKLVTSGREIVVKTQNDLHEIVTDYISLTKRNSKVLKVALQANDFGTISSIAHKMAGSAGSFGLEDLSVLGRQLEGAAGEKDAQVVTNLVGKVQDYLLNVKVVKGGDD